MKFTIIFILFNINNFFLAYYNNKISILINNNITRSNLDLYYNSPKYKFETFNVLKKRVFVKTYIKNLLILNKNR